MDIMATSFHDSWSNNRKAISQQPSLPEANQIPHVLTESKTLDPENLCLTPANIKYLLILLPEPLK
jgi:hypothetical protein